MPVFALAFHRVLCVFVDVAINSIHASMRSFFRYTRQEKRGIVFLLFLIALVQCGIFYLDFSAGRSAHSLVEVDSLAIAFVDSAKQAARAADTLPIRPFNPNFISDYKGYLLGMTPEEIDRLHAFRKEGRYVRDAEEFRRVTGISDSLLKRISPYFNFPKFRRSQSKKNLRPALTSQKKDLNSVTAADLQAVSGIGPVLSDRIVRFRKSLGGFLVKEQLLDVYGLDTSVAKRAMAAFSLKQIPVIKRINLNTAGVEELTQLVYLNRRMARSIIAYREAHGKFDSIEQLTKIEEFPKQRIGRIKLYLGL